MPDVKLSPEEEAEVEKKREDHRAQQPYASELDDRELEHAHKEGRPVEAPSDVDFPRTDRPAAR